MTSIQPRTPPRPPHEPKKATAVEEEQSMAQIMWADIKQFLSDAVRDAFRDADLKASLHTGPSSSRFEIECTTPTRTWALQTSTVTDPSR